MKPPNSRKIVMTQRIERRVNTVLKSLRDLEEMKAEPWTEQEVGKIHTVIFERLGEVTASLRDPKNRHGFRFDD